MLKVFLLIFLCSGNKEMFVNWSIVSVGLSRGTQWEWDCICTGFYGDIAKLVIFPIPQIGIGTAGCDMVFLPSDNLDAPERMAGGFLPVYFYIGLWNREWSIFGVRFVDIIAGYFKILFWGERYFDTGIELSCGVFLQVRAGYAKTIPKDRLCFPEDSYYLSLGLKLGAINVLKK